MESRIVRDLIERLKKLPGVSLKQAEKMAFMLLQERSARQAVSEVVTLLEGIEQCPSCGWFSMRSGVCENCSRDQSVICVVEHYSDMFQIEKTGEYTGSYHVLGGLIAPLEGVLPEDLNAQALQERAQSGAVQEIIIALPSTIEGEATIHYLAELLKDTGVSLTRTARGMPAGAKVEYLDRKTIGFALKDRVGV